MLRIGRATFSRPTFHLVYLQKVMAKFTCRQTILAQIAFNRRVRSHAHCLPDTPPERACQSRHGKRSCSPRCCNPSQCRRSPRSIYEWHLPSQHPRASTSIWQDDEEEDTDPKPAVTLNTCGGIKLMSVEEPEPGTELGFTSVVSTSVQPSPLKPHWPGVGS